MARGAHFTSRAAAPSLSFHQSSSLLFALLGLDEAMTPAGLHQC